MDHNLFNCNATTETLHPWNNQERWLAPLVDSSMRWSSSVLEVTSGSKIDAVMQEFRMNGLDSPYEPQDTLEGPSLRNADLLGLGPPSQYIRQKSWPAPERTPIARLPQYTSSAGFLNSSDEEFIPPEPSLLTEQQQQVLSTIPNTVLYHLLWEMVKTREQEKTKRKELECRFCKNNGEREQYYRTHCLRADGRVTCPVLRALVCRQCGAHGDHAHTIKYCPLTSPAQRKKSAAMMQSLRLASGRRRQKLQYDDMSAEDYVVFGEFSKNLLRDGEVCDPHESPLDPMWAALERKLML